MLRCNDCRDLILDHLYGLLDAAEGAEVAAHLTTCPACAAVRDESARVQGLIAKAARGAFPQVRFEAPVAKSRTAPAAPARSAVTLPFPDAPKAAPAPAKTTAGSSRATPVGRWLPWAVAAAVLLAVPGTVVPVLGVLDRANSARDESAAAVARESATLRELETVERGTREARAAVRLRLAEAQQAHDNVLAKWVESEQAAVVAQTAPKVTFNVRKPATVQPGAPNEFMLAVADRGRGPAGRLVAEFRDQTDAVIYSEPIAHEKVAGGEHTVRLPAAVWAKLKPQDELFLVVTRVDDKTDQKTVIQDKVRLLGPVYATVLTTDRPAYRPGETVFFRSLTLDRVTFTPPTREQVLHYELRGPHGAPVRAAGGGSALVRLVEGKLEPVLGPDGKPVRGVGCGEFSLPPDAADGDYTLVMRESHAPGQMPLVVFPVTRTFKVRSSAVEAYRKEVAYLGASSYSAGDTVEAVAELFLGREPVAGAEVRDVTVTADGHRVEVAGPQRTDENGRANLRFILPPSLPRGDVKLRVTFAAKSGEAEIVESIADRVPVVGRNVVVEFFPEGGELVAGVPSRVYFRATTPSGHPVDVRGTLFAATPTDGRRKLARVETLTDVEAGANRGIGSFEFTPELGVPVWLTLDQPAGAFAPLIPPENGKFPSGQAALVGGPAVAVSRTGFLLPEAKRDGVVMRVPDAVTSPGQPVRVHLWSAAQTRHLVVGAYTRGRLSDTQRVTAERGKMAEVRLMTGADPRGGVVRITVFEDPEGGEAGKDVKEPPAADLKPVAERLVFRRPGDSLSLSLTTLGRSVTPSANQFGLAAGVTTDGDRRAAGFAPGSRVELDITAKDEKGNPAAAILYACAVNTAARGGDRKDRLLTTHFLIAGEVSTPDAMEYADFLLTDHPKAPVALDLVLATQGWRRFAEQSQEGLVRSPRFGSTSEKAALQECNGQFTVAAEPAWVREHQRVREAFWPRYEAAVKALEAAQNADRLAAAGWSDDDSRARQLAAAARSAAESARAADERADAAAAPVARFRGAAWYAVAGFALLAGLLGVAAVVRPAARLPLGLGTAGSLGLVAFLFVALGMAERTHAAGQAHEELAKASEPAFPIPAAGVADRAEEIPPPHPVVRPPVLPPTMPGMLPKGGAVNGAFGGNVAGGAVGGGLGGGGVVPPGVLPPATTVAPDAGPNAKKDPKHDAKVEAKATPAPLRPGSGGSPPGGPGGFVPKDGGWQPGRGLIQIDELARKREVDRLLKFRRVELEMALPGGVPAPAAGMAAMGTPATPTRGGDKTGDTKAAKKDADAYKQAEEKLWAEYAERATKIRDEMSKEFFNIQPVPLQLDGRAKLPLALQRVQQGIPSVPPLIVREYAAPRPGTEAREADGLAPDTVLWQPVIVLPSDGRGKVAFHVGDAAGGYEVVVAGHTLDGRIGAVRGFVPVTPVVQSEGVGPPLTPAPVAPGKP